jgi:hypothetical protein
LEFIINVTLPMHHLSKHKESLEELFRVELSRYSMKKTKGERKKKHAHGSKG